MTRNYDPRTKMVSRSTPLSSTCWEFGEREGTIYGTDYLRALVEWKDDHSRDWVVYGVLSLEKGKCIP